MARKRSEQIKQALMKYILEVANTKEKKEELSRYLEKSFPTVDSLVYKGKGSFSSWINAILYRFELDPETVVKSLEHLSTSTRKQYSHRPSDKIWFELDKDLSEDEKFYWASLIKAAVALEREIGKK